MLAYLAWWDTRAVESGGGEALLHSFTSHGRMDALTTASS